MEAVLLYLGKLMICSGVTFLYYQLSLKDRTFHHYNRFYLLSAMFISVLLPLVQVEDFTIEVSSDLYRLISGMQDFNTVNDTGHDYIYIAIVFSALGLVSLFFLGRLVYGILKIRRFQDQYRRETFDGINFYRTDLSEAPFSFFRNLFWKNSIMLDSDLGRQVLKHEMVHIEQKHSFDKIFIEIMTSVFWFNPFFHLIKKEISLIHEYLADKKAVRHSDTKAFAQMLLASHFSGTPLPATSPFLSSNLKKRLRMLQKPKTRFGYARRILALPVVFTVAFAYLVNAKNQEIKATNQEIEKAVSRIGNKKETVSRKDTIVPDKKDPVILPKVNRKQEDDKRITELSEKLQQQAGNLNTLEPKSDEYYKSLEEITKLSGEIAKIAVSRDYLKSAMVIRMNGKDMNINDYFKSKEWKDEVKKLEDLDIEIPDMPEINLDIPDAPPSPPDAPETPRVKVLTFNGMRDRKWTPGTGLIIKSVVADESPSMARKRAKLEKERARLEKKRAKLEGERAQLMVQRRALGMDNKTAMGNIVKNFPDMKNLRVNADNIRINFKDQSLMASGIKGLDGDAENIKIYINGKESTGKEMQALDPKIIKSMNVNKKSTDGSKTTGDIRIETK